MSAIRTNKKRNNPPKINRVDAKRTKAKRKRRKLKKVARRLAFKLASELSKEDKRISEDECDFDFDNSGRALYSTSEDDSDGPQGED